MPYSMSSDRLSFLSIKDIEDLYLLFGPALDKAESMGIHHLEFDLVHSGINGFQVKAGDVSFIIGSDGTVKDIRSKA